MSLAEVVARAKKATTSAPCPFFPELDAAYELGKKLGRGCFATVYKARRRSDDVTVAVKAVEKKRLDSETAQLLQNELEVLQAVSEHPGIVTLLDSVEIETYMFFIMEYVDGGPLLDRIVSRGNFSENDARVLMRAILQTLHYLADLGCVHRDVKPENILVDNYSKKWPVKLTDFGLSAKMQPDELLHATLGTPLFVAPEILKGEGYDCACDMWSLGVVLYLVLCGYPPFPYENPKELITAITNGHYSFPAPEWDHVSSDAKDALSRMMEIDPKRRITPADALKHPWFRAEQSTSDLPNTRLKTFNARRKLKATIFAVSTISKFTYKRRSFTPGGKPPTQKQLLEDVEHSRKMIQKMGIKENGTLISGLENTKKVQSESDVVKPLSRRSLVLPSTLFESLLSSKATNYTNASNGCDEGEPTGRTFALQSSDAAPWNSQVMSSRAKALVAEVKGSFVLEGSQNPFLVLGQQRSSSQEASPSMPNRQQSENQNQSVRSEKLTSKELEELLGQFSKPNEDNLVQEPTESKKSEPLPERSRPLMRLDLEGLGIL